MAMKVAEMIEKVKNLIGGLKRDQRIVVLVRHGDKDEGEPKDTINATAKKAARLLGARLRKAGLIIMKVISSPRGRAAYTALEVATGNTNADEAVMPLTTDQQITDVSSERPDLVPILKEFMAGSNVKTVEEALLVCPDSTVQEYSWQKANAYKRAIVTRCRMKNGEHGPIMFVVHGGPLDIAIALMKQPLATCLTDLRRPEKWIPKGGCTILVIDENTGAVVNEKRLF